MSKYITAEQYPIRIGSSYVDSIKDIFKYVAVTCLVLTLYICVFGYRISDRLPDFRYLNIEKESLKYESKSMISNIAANVKPTLVPLLTTSTVGSKVSEKLKPQIQKTLPQTKRTVPQTQTTLHQTFNSSINQIKIIIVAEHRGGSTLVSEMFNKNKNAFYIFEPLVLADKNPTEAVNILRDILYDCKYPDINKYLKMEYDGHLNKTLEECVEHNICFRIAMSLFNQKPFCNLKMNGIRKNSGSHNISTTAQLLFSKILCKSQPIDYELYTKVCKQKKIVVAKVIRLDALETLKVFQNDPNFFIIYPIRDPRAMATSRIRLKYYTGRTNVIRDVCKKYKTNLKYLESSTSNWLRNKMLILRYEEFALDPVFYIEKLGTLVNFTNGFKEVKHTIVAETTVRNNNVDDYSVEKNAKTKVYQWRNKTNFKMAQDVQKYCGRNIFKALGYRWYESLDEYKSKNINKIPVLDEWLYDKNVV